MGFQVVIESQINISKSSQWFMQCPAGQLWLPTEPLTVLVGLLNCVTWQINSTH